MPHRAPARRTILIVDDHPVFRDGLVRLINQEKDLLVCGEAADGPDALRRADSLKPDLVVIDISLEGMSGIDLAKSLRARLPRTRMLVVSMHPESLYAERALRAGANGYVMKRESGRTLIDAIRHVLDGRTYISQELNANILQRVTAPSHEAQ